MARRSWRRLIVLCGLAILIANLNAPFGAEKAPFYQGKTLNIIINFAAGGPTDIESRIFAKHLTEVGAAAERLFKQASQVSPEVVNFQRAYIDEANR